MTVPILLLEADSTTPPAEWSPHPSSKLAAFLAFGAAADSAFRPGSAKGLGKPMSFASKGHGLP